MSVVTKGDSRERGHEVIAHHEIHGLGRLECRRPEWCPGSIQFGLEHPLVTTIDHAVPVTTIAHVRCCERHGNQGGKAAEARIEHAALVVDLHGEEHMRQRSLASRPHQNDARGMDDWLETEMYQSRLEQEPVLEAVAAAMCGHEFGVDTIGIDSNGPPQQHIEILERDVRHVSAKDTGKSGERRLARTVPANPHEVAVEIEWCQGCGGPPSGIGWPPTVRPP